MPSRRLRWLAGVLLAGALAVVTAVVLHGPALRLLGRWLVVDDPLAPADAIVVLAGGTPSREIEAAALYRQGLAPRVVVSRPVTPPHHVALMKLGIRAHDWQSEARLVLQAEGVPAAAIVALQTPVKRTEAELALVHDTARASGYRRLILVTSSDHGRRVSMIWARQPRAGIEALVHSARDGSFSPDRWWRERRMFELLLHEYLGILALSLGLSNLMN